VDTDVAGVREADTLRQAGHRMRELGVAVLAVYGADGRKRGTVSRDMIVRRIAVGGDPRVVTVGELAPPPVPPRRLRRMRAALTARRTAADTGRTAADTGRAADTGASASRTPGWLP
jgi:CBS domain-containing protein